MSKTKKIMLAAALAIVGILVCVSVVSVSSKQEEIKWVRATYRKSEILDFDESKSLEEIQGAQNKGFSVKNESAAMDQAAGAAMEEAVTESTAEYDSGVDYEEYGNYDSYDTEVPKTEGSKPLSELKVQGDYLHWTHNVNAETINYDDVEAQLSKVVEEADGYVESADVYSTEYRDYKNNIHSVREGQFVIRLPETSVSKLKDVLDTYSHITSASQSCEDLTESYVDTETKLNSLSGEKETLEGLLKDAENVQDVLAIRDRIAAIEGQLEYYHKMMENLKKDVSYSTFNLTLDEVIYYQKSIEYYQSTVLENWAETAKGWFSNVVPAAFFGLITIIPFVLLLMLSVLLTSRKLVDYKLQKTVEFEKGTFAAGKNTKIKTVKAKSKKGNNVKSDHTEEQSAAGTAAEESSTEEKGTGGTAAEENSTEK